MFWFTPRILLFSTLLVACGCSSDPAVNPHGPCAGPIADYEELNNVAPENSSDGPGQTDANGNHRVVYIGRVNGETVVTSFNWGPDYEGCQVNYN